VPSTRRSPNSVSAAYASLNYIGLRFIERSVNRTSSVSVTVRPCVFVHVADREVLVVAPLPSADESAVRLGAVPSSPCVSLSRAVPTPTTNG